MAGKRVRGAQNGLSRELVRAVAAELRTTLTKAAAPSTGGIQPGLAMVLAGAPRGTQPRRYGLQDAINLATGYGRTSQWAGALTPLERDPLDDGPFGPGQPLVPVPIDPANPATGRPDPRIYQFAQSWNLPGNSRREVPWQVLRQAAQQIGIIRRCIEARKKHVRTLQWSWAVRGDVVEAEYAKDPSKGALDTAAMLREKYEPEIRRLTELWKTPWKTAPGGPWNFGQWANSLMEEYLVTDAIAINPRMTYGGDLFAFEQIDGATIKPLLDHRGSMPLPPNPAYQQELHGFIRGEWTATVTMNADGQQVIENGYPAGSIFYYRENARLHSPYGFSAVEQCLFDARLYLRRHGWLLAEYDDGSTPLTFLEVPENPAHPMSTADRRAWEKAINEELAGQDAARHRMKVGMPGLVPHQLSSADERYKPEFDLFLIKNMCGWFGLTATELGYSEQQGLGSSGWAENQSDVAGRVGLKPDVKVLAGIINEISSCYAKAPAELEFSFLDPASENDAESDGVADAQLKRGVITLNDDRRRLKLPLYDIPEADQPMLVGVGTNGYVFLDGAKQAAEDAAAAATAQQQAAAEGTTGKLELEAAKLDDSKAAREEEREFARENRDAEQAFAREQAEITKAAYPDGAHTGAMVALVPTAADAARLAVDGGEPADQLHLTLRYLGKAADFHEQSREHLVDLVRGYFDGVPAFTANGFNVAMFNPTGDDPCITLGVGGDDIARAHAKVAAAVEDYGADLPEPHKPFVPHITLVYTGDASMVEELVDRAGPVTFDRVRVAFAGQAVDIPLADPGTIAKAVTAELAAFRTWRRRNPTPRRPFVFKTATPDHAPELATIPPEVADFGPGWEWVDVGDLLKAAGMDWRAWNAAHPNRPRDARGRWVKRGTSGAGPLADALRELAEPRRPAVTDAHIRSLGDEQLYRLFADVSAADELDEDLARRLVADMDRREQLDREHPWLTASEQWDFNTPATAPEADLRDDDMRRQAAAAAVDRLPGETLDQAVRRSYDEQTHLAYLAAERATKGHMLNPAGRRAGIDPLTLWTGPLSRARRYASEDLLRFWAQHGRQNYTEYRAQVLARQRDLAAAAVTAGLSSGRDFI